MSFFGFDPNAPPGGHGNPNEKFEALDFDDLEEEDAFNDETFGAAATLNINNDFNFSLGGNSGSSTSKSALKPAPIPENNKISYATAAHTTVDDVLKPMASLWADEKTTERDTEQPQVLSLQEIEAKLKQQSQAATLANNSTTTNNNNNMMQNNQPFQIPPYIAQIIYQPQVQQQIMSVVSSGRFPNVQTATQAMIQSLMSAPNQMMQMAPPNMQNQFGIQNNMQNMMNLPSNQQMQQMQQMQMQQIQQQQQQMQHMQQIQQMQQQNQQHQQQPMQNSPSITVNESQPLPKQQSQSQPLQQESQLNVTDQRVNSTDFPSIEAASAKGPSINSNNFGVENVLSQSQTQNQNYDQNQNPIQTQTQNQQRQRQFQSNNQIHQNQRFHQHQHHNHFQRQQHLQQQMENMSPEERERFLIRQQKVSRITRCSGFMTPKDKDFVTRFQLSQIVTDDPYNEDFYCQVYKVLNSSTSENNMNSLAQKYLEQSGHRLGGRSKRADIALQRMQQQVSKAVSVAKERGESTGILAKEGALGKVSFGSGKQPRRQLIIHSADIDNDKDLKSDKLNNEDVILPKEYTFSKSSRAFQLSIIEKIYNEVLKLESLERENQPFETIDLWKSLHLNDIIKTSSNEVVNPFISILSFDKMMKLFGRMFHFFSVEQKAELVSQIFIHLQNIDVVMKGSYKNYETSNFEIPDDVNKKISLFQMTILKCLVIYLSEANFSYVLSWLNTIVSNKNILFLTTTKIGLSLITVLISRLELIKQEFSKLLSAQELSQWQYVYDQLFQSLEGRLASCFPPYISHDETRKVVNKESNEDDSYVWQFLASLSLAGVLNYQRIIVDEIRNEIFGIMAVAKSLKTSGDVDSSTRYLGNLNLFLNVMGLMATEDDITELSD